MSMRKKNVRKDVAFSKLNFDKVRIMVKALGKVTSLQTYYPKF